MKVSDFNYNLPKELIAQVPIKDRDQSRLMVLDRKNKTIEHKIFKDIIDYLEPGDCLVRNNTKVIPARLYGVKEETGANVEFLLLKRVDGDIWEVMVKPGRKLMPGVRVEFGNGLLKAEILEKFEDGNRKVKFEYNGIFNEILNEIGLMPLPPYIHEKLKEKDRYQTVYAKYEGSAAAPTAGLHFTEDEIKSMEKITNDAKDVLLSKSGAGSDFLGWIDLPVDYDKDEFARIQKAAQKIQSDSEVLLVIGIGGSYLGARAAIEFLRHGFYNSVSKEIRKTPEIYYCGNSLSGTYLKQLIEVVGDRDFSVNIISKSGTTTEPAVAFRIFKEMLENKYGKEEAAKRIYATTDKAKGALKNLATEEGYETFVVPDDVGGRFSVLTAVGLLPIAVRDRKSVV